MLKSPIRNCVAIALVLGPLLLSACKADDRARMEEICTQSFSGVISGDMQSWLERSFDAKVFQSYGIAPEQVAQEYTSQMSTSLSAELDTFCSCTSEAFVSTFPSPLVDFLNENYVSIVFSRPHPRVEEELRNFAPRINVRYLNQLFNACGADLNQTWSNVYLGDRDAFMAARTAATQNMVEKYPEFEYHPPN